jgi:hypothetical protein
LQSKREPRFATSGLRRTAGSAAQETTLKKLMMSVFISIGAVAAGFQPAFAASGEGAATCSQGPWVFRDLETMKLKDGEHSLGTVESPQGKWEARVNVSRGRVSDPVYFLGGKRLHKVSSSKVPKDLRECMRLKRTAMLDNLLGPPAALLDSIVPPAEARKTCRPTILSAGCSQTVCCALASCGSSRAVHCVAV